MDAIIKSVDECVCHLILIVPNSISYNLNEREDITFLASARLISFLEGLQSFMKTLHANADRKNERNWQWQAHPEKEKNRALFTFYLLAQIHWTPTSFPEALHPTLELWTTMHRTSKNMQRHILIILLNVHKETQTDVFCSESDRVRLALVHPSGKHLYTYSWGTTFRDNVSLTWVQPK